MATMTVSLPDAMKDWIDAQIRQGDYASTSDYVRHLVLRDRERRQRSELSLVQLREIIAEARAEGSTDATVGDIMARARATARSPGAKE